MRFIKTILNLYRLLPAWACVVSLDNASKTIVLEEMDYWGKCMRKQESCFKLFSYLVLTYKEYRNLLVFRLGGVRRYLIKFLFPPMETLYINAEEIGRCLFIQHGFATNITAKRIGDFCWINQQVTIGYTFDPEPPVIGNGVRISAGAKVLGQITVGDNAIIAANAAVVKDVQQCQIVGGVPAKVIGHNDEHKLYAGH